MRQGIVFDGDDTLWLTESLYDDARNRARSVVEAAGLDGAKWEQTERRLDVANVKLLGYTVSRFPRSCVEAYEQRCAVEGRPAQPDVRTHVREAAQTAFTAIAPLMPSARQILAALADRGFRLALLTKGDPELQRRRIEQSGLAPFFDLIEVVDTKTPEVIESVLDRLEVPAEAALSVGNSLRSDVLPSLAAGVKSVWIDAHVWEHERDHEAVPEGEVIEIDSLDRLLDLVPV
jgi:putative hydrolase of the HAD superfamily